MSKPLYTRQGALNKSEALGLKVLLREKWPVYKGWDYTLQSFLKMGQYVCTLPYPDVLEKNLATVVHRTGFFILITYYCWLYVEKLIRNT